MGSCDIPVKDHQYDFACSHQKYLLSRAQYANWDKLADLMKEKYSKMGN